MFYIALQTFCIHEFPPLTFSAVSLLICFWYIVKGDAACGLCQCFIPVSLGVTCTLHFLPSSLKYF